MADRADLLDRLVLALSRPGVDGVLGTPDVLEDLLLLGALDGKVVIGSMNRGGLAGHRRSRSTTGSPRYDAAGDRGRRVRGRQDAAAHRPRRPGHRRHPGGLRATPSSDLAAHGLMAMVEPFISHRVDGRVRNDLTAEAMIRAQTVAAGLGRTSAYTWLKVPVVEDMERVMAATTLPALLLGGEVADDQDAAFASWGKALALPTVQGLVVGRSLLYPPDGDVAGGRRRGGGAAVTRARPRPAAAEAAGDGRSPWSSPRDRRLGLQRRCGSWSSTAGGSATFATGEDEMLVLPLRGRLHGRPATGETFELTGRRDVFTRVTDFAYVPRDAEVTVSSADGRPVRAARRPREPAPAARYGPAEDVPVELRGAGPGQPAGQQLLHARPRSRPTS